MKTQKILHKDIEVSATCVRVPVLRSHSEAITIHFDKDVSADAAREVLSKAPSVVVVDNPAKKEYPMPTISSDTNETYVGRIRVDNFRSNVLHLWCSADQIRVGACDKCREDRTKMDHDAGVVCAKINCDFAPKF